MYYLKARYYDPNTAQFTQEDTVQDDNLQYNLYGYCSGNPVKYIDPSGHNATSLRDWASSMWWLTTIDGPAPIGDTIYWGGIAISFISSLFLVQTNTVTKTIAKTKSRKSEAEKTYFHFTSEAVATTIKLTGRITAKNRFEPYIYAWGKRPSKKH